MIQRKKNISPGPFREHMHFIPAELKLRLKIQKYFTAFFLLAISALFILILFVDYSGMDYYDMFLTCATVLWSGITGIRMIYNVTFKKDGYKNDPEL